MTIAISLYFLAWMRAADAEAAIKGLFLTTRVRSTVVAQSTPDFSAA